MKVMLTGSTGFIGGHIMKALVEAGHEVQALVRDTEERRKECKARAKITTAIPVN